MIGGTYEYLMSSLPDLQFQNTNEVKQEVTGLLQKYAGSVADQYDPVKILDIEAQKFLPVSRYRIFKKMNLKNIHNEDFQHIKSKVVSNFSRFSFELKTQLKAWRTAQNSDERKSVKNHLDHILSAGTPLEKEIQIMKYQWHKLEDLSAGHFSDVEALFTYKLKLLILLRWWSFDAQTGFEKFTRITTKK